MNVDDFPTKKFTVMDILRISSPDDIFVIRDVTPGKRAHGPDDDGIIYRGKRNSILYDDMNHYGNIPEMEVIKIQGYTEEYKSGYQLTVRASGTYCECPNCGHTFRIRQ